MNISNLHILYYHVSETTCFQNNLLHEKSLPFISIVQAIEGQYGISINNSPKFLTGEMGAFIAPSHKFQSITHMVNPNTEIMRAQWIFLDVILNNKYHIDDIFEFPVIMPPIYNKEIYEIIKNVLSSEDICDKQIEILKLVKILFKIGRKKIIICEGIFDSVEYIHNNYSEKLNISDLCEIAKMSVAVYYRYFKKEMNVSPLVYINDYRLSQAVVLLETKVMPISEISEAVGIGDQFYFSKLFKKKYGISPNAYKMALNRN